MSWLDPTLELLARSPVCGYHRDAAAATEPTALAALALLGHRRKDAARSALQWLRDRQAADGSVGVDGEHATPCWPTGWAALAWRAAGDLAYVDAADRAIAWLLSSRGAASPQTAIMGHDTTLVAWPWVAGTHSWVEPTAINLLALRSAGLGHHARSREAVRLLIDRMIPSGGWNAGNKIVFGRELRPQVQATGLALVALADESDRQGELLPSLEYLERSLSAETSLASLSYGLIGLAAHGRRPAEADSMLASAAARTLQRGAPPYPLALAAIASAGSLFHGRK